METRILKILVAVYFALSPFYIFDSGSMQPSHMLLLFLIGFNYMFVNRMRKFVVADLGYLENRSITAMGVFFVYIFIVSIVVAVYHSSVGAMTSFVYYLYSGICYLFFIDILSKNKSMARYLVSILMAVVVLLSLAMIFGLGGYWHDSYPILFFNNPNQLGYYVILISSIIIYLGVLVGVKGRYIYLVSALCFYLVYSAVSVSSAFGIALGVSLLTLYLLRRKPRLAVSFLVVFLLAIILNVEYLQDIYYASQAISGVSGLEAKFAAKTSRVGGWSVERGYDTLYGLDAYIIFGIGDLPGRYAKEFHSTFGAILRAYGLIGIGMFLFFLYRITRGVDTLLFLVSFAPIFVYGVAHNGIRQPLLWMFFAIVTVSANSRGARGR